MGLVLLLVDAILLSVILVSQPPLFEDITGLVLIAAWVMVDPYSLTYHLQCDTATAFELAVSRLREEWLIGGAHAVHLPSQ